MYSNPFLGLWLSTANAFWSVARQQAMIQSRRYVSTMIDEAWSQTFRFWGDALRIAPPPRRARRRAVRYRP